MPEKARPRKRRTREFARPTVSTRSPSSVRSIRSGWVGTRFEHPPPAASRTSTAARDPLNSLDTDRPRREGTAPTLPAPLHTLSRAGRLRQKFARGPSWSAIAAERLPAVTLHAVRSAARLRGLCPPGLRADRGPDARRTPLPVLSSPGVFLSTAETTTIGSGPTFATR